MGDSDTYDALKLRNQLCFPVYLCAKEITQRYAPFLEEIDLTYTQYIVMMYFWEKGESNMKEAGKALLLDPSTLTPLLNKLEKKLNSDVIPQWTIDESIIAGLILRGLPIVVCEKNKIGKGQKKIVSNGHLVATSCKTDFL